MEMVAYQSRLTYYSTAKLRPDSGFCQLQIQLHFHIFYIQEEIAQKLVSEVYYVPFLKNHNY